MEIPPQDNNHIISYIRGMKRDIANIQTFLSDVQKLDPALKDLTEIYKFIRAHIHHHHQAPKQKGAPPNILYSNFLHGELRPTSSTGEVTFQPFDKVYINWPIRKHPFPTPNPNPTGLPYTPNTQFTVVSTNSNGSINIKESSSTTSPTFMVGKYDISKTRPPDPLFVNLPTRRGIKETIYPGDVLTRYGGPTNAFGAKERCTVKAYNWNDRTFTCKVDDVEKRVYFEDFDQSMHETQPDLFVNPLGEVEQVLFRDF